MKRFLIPFIALLMLGAGCAQKTPTEQPAATTTEPVATTTQDVTATSTQAESPYQKWAIKRDDWFFDNVNNQTDCVGVSNGMTHGGDLLSTLIIEPESRTNLKLNVYTPAYLKTLEKQLADNFKSDMGSNNVYAFDVCHIKDKVDVVAAYIWPSGESLPDDNSRQTYFELQYVAHLFILDHGKVTEQNDVQLLDNTATGADVEPCKATPSGDKIKWSCFLGVNYKMDASGQIVGSDGAVMKRWLFPYGDGPVTSWTEVVKNVNK